MSNLQPTSHQISRVDRPTNRSQSSLKLVYIIGRYPELTTTFIEREINTLEQLGNTQIKTVSIRQPLTLTATLPEYKKIRDNTLYLTPVNALIVIVAHLYFILSRPVVLLKTFIYLLFGGHPDLNSRLMTILHFGLGVYTAYLLRHQEFDHIHVHFIDRAVVLALVVSRLLNKPYSLTAHANDIFVKQILIREKIGDASFMVTVSNYNKSYLLKSYPNLHPDKIHILHPWVDITQFIPPASRSADYRLRILGVGRLVEKKGFVDLIEACHLLDQRRIDFECRIVGDGPLKSALEAQIDRHQLQHRVQLLGSQPQSEVRRLLSEWADVFTLPCVVAQDGDRDGMPVSLAEAMAMELPVISTEIVGIGELVQPGTGILVPPHDPATLAEALQEMQAQNLTERLAMGRCGRAVVDAEFNLLSGVSQLASLFQQAVAAGQEG